MKQILLLWIGERAVHSSQWHNYDIRLYCFHLFQEEGLNGHALDVIAILRGGTYMGGMRSWLTSNDKCTRHVNYQMKDHMACLAECTFALFQGHNRCLQLQGKLSHRCGGACRTCCIRVRNSR